MTAKEPSPSPGHGSPSPPPGSSPVLPGKGSTDYERYMRVDDLLALQKKPSELAHHDEMLFQTMHQTYELWLNVVLFEWAEAARLMEQGRAPQATTLIVRNRRIVEVLRQQIHVLDTMTPWDFHDVRRQLGRGSGAESPGFRRVLLEVPKHWKSFQGLLRSKGVDLIQVYTDQDKHYDLLKLAEALTDFDAAFHLWRQDHLALVKRIIGRDVKSLKGYAVHQLETDVQELLFPELWIVRNKITELAGTSPQ